MVRPAGAKITGNGTSQMEWCLFARYTIQQYLPLIKDLSAEELRQLILILITPTLKNGWRLENQKEMSIDNHLTYTSALWSVTSLCEDLRQGDPESRQKWARAITKT